MTHPRDMTFLRVGEQPTLNIVFEDPCLMAVIKPAGQLFQGFTKGAPAPLDVQVKEYLHHKKPGGSPNVYLGIVHRLDRPVSGVVLFGLNSKFTGRLAEQIQTRQIEKTYLAVVEGHWAENEGELIDELPKHIPGEKNADAVDESELQHCQLRYKVTQRGTTSTQLIIQLGTGRRNQIRRQFSLRGHPLVGDQKFGARALFPGTSEVEPLFRPIALHALSLKLAHPKTKSELFLEAPIPGYWDQLLSR